MLTRHRLPGGIITLATIPVGMAGLFLGGCAGSGAAADAEDTNTGLAALSTQGEPRPAQAGPPRQASPTPPLDRAPLATDDIDRVAKELAAFLNERTPAVGSEMPNPAATGEEAVAPIAATEEAAEPDPTAAPPPGEPVDGETPPAAKALTAQERAAHATRDLMEALRARAEDPDAPLEEAARAEILGVLASALLVDDPKTVRAPPRKLPPADIRALGAIEAFVRALGGEGDVIAKAASEARVLANALEEERGVRIAVSELCWRVEGFGRFTPVSSASFRAGTAHRLVLYVEVEGFTHRQAQGTDAAPGSRWIVELSQELNLWHDSGTPMLAWRRPPGAVRESLRSRRRDFFIVQDVELPSTLAVGPYTLKVTVRDLSSKAIAEASIPIRIVANEAAKP